MNLNNNYTLNSHYILKNDEKRAIITNKAGRDFFPDIIANDSFLSIIHPLHAMLLSFFTDEKKLSEKLIELSNFFGTDEKKILDFISNLCENESEFTHQFSGASFNFPKNILVKNTKYTGKKYKTSDFNISPSDFDFSSPRFYKPLDAVLVINTNCVTDCIYCYADKSHTYNLLTTERIKEILQEAKRIGMRNIDISGGEFLLHRDWEKILTAFIENGFHPYLSTKVPMNENTISKLKDIGVKSMQVSIDTIDDDEAEKVLKEQMNFIILLATV